MRKCGDGSSKGPAADGNASDFSGVAMGSRSWVRLLHSKPLKFQAELKWPTYPWWACSGAVDDPGAGSRAAFPHRLAALHSRRRC